METCCYCGQDYAPDAYHERERLGPYCSHGCRLAVEAPLSNHGQSHVSMDAGADGPVALAVYLSDDGEIETRSCHDEAASEVTARSLADAVGGNARDFGLLADWLAAWIRLPPKLREAAAARIVQYSQRGVDVAASLGSTSRTYFKRLRTIGRKIPQLDGFMRTYRKREKADAAVEHAKKEARRLATGRSDPTGHEGRTGAGSGQHRRARCRARRTGGGSVAPGVERVTTILNSPPSRESASRSTTASRSGAGALHPR